MKHELQTPMMIAACKKKLLEKQKKNVRIEAEMEEKVGWTKSDWRRHGCSRGDERGPAVVFLNEAL
jgi:hypothetical protein